MKCSYCHNPSKLEQQKVVVDTCVKTYVCECGYKTTLERFGNDMILDGKVLKMSDWWEPCDLKHGQQ